MCVHPSCPLSFTMCVHPSCPLSFTMCVHPSCPLSKVLYNVCSPSCPLSKVLYNVCSSFLPLTVFELVFLFSSNTLINCQKYHMNFIIVCTKSWFFFCRSCILADLFICFVFFLSLSGTQSVYQRKFRRWWGWCSRQGQERGAEEIALNWSCMLSRKLFCF